MQNSKRSLDEEDVSSAAKKARLCENQVIQVQGFPDKNNSNGIIRIYIPPSTSSDTTQSQSILQDRIINIPFPNDRCQLSSPSRSQNMPFPQHSSETSASNILRNIAQEKMHMEQIAAVKSILEPQDNPSQRQLMVSQQLEGKPYHSVQYHQQTAGNLPVCDVRKLDDDGQQQVDVNGKNIRPKTYEIEIRPTQQPTTQPNVRSLQDRGGLMNASDLKNNVNVTNISIPVGALKEHLTIPIPTSGANVVYLKPAANGGTMSVVQQGVLTPTKQGGPGGQVGVVNKVNLVPPISNTLQGPSSGATFVTSGTGTIRPLYYVTATKADGNFSDVSKSRKNNPAPDVMPGTGISYKTPGANYRNRNGNIKRPMNAFMVWARTYRRVLAQSMPHASNAEISVRLGQLWADMPHNEKQQYYREAEKIKIQHHRDFPGWVYKPNQTKKPTDTQHERLWAKYGSSQAAAAAANTTYYVSPTKITASNSTAASFQTSQTDTNRTYPVNSAVITSTSSTDSQRPVITEFKSLSSDPEVKQMASDPDVNKNANDITRTECDDSQKDEHGCKEVDSVVQKLPCIATLLKRSTEADSNQKVLEEKKNPNTTTLQPGSPGKERPVQAQDTPGVLGVDTCKTSKNNDTTSLDKSASNVKTNSSSMATVTNPSSLATVTNSVTMASVAAADPRTKVTQNRPVGPTRKGRPPTVTRRVEYHAQNEVTPPCNRKSKETKRQTKTGATGIRKNKANINERGFNNNEANEKGGNSALREADFHHKPDVSTANKNSAQLSFSRQTSSSTSLSANDTNTDLWPFPFPTIDHDVHAEVSFGEDLHDSQALSNGYIDPYHPFYYDNQYDGVKRHSSYQVDVSSWQSYLNDNKEPNTNKTTLNCFTPGIKIEKEEYDENLDINPTPAAVTLQRDPYSYPGHSETGSPGNRINDNYTSENCSKSGTTDSGACYPPGDGHYTGNPSDGYRYYGTYSTRENQDELNPRFSCSFTSAIKTLDNYDEMPLNGRLSASNEEALSVPDVNQNACRSSENEGDGQSRMNIALDSSPRGKQEDSRPLKKRSDRFMRDFQTEVQQGDNFQDVADVVNGSYVSSLLIGTSSDVQQSESQSQPFSQERPTIVHSGEANSTTYHLQSL